MLRLCALFAAILVAGCLAPDRPVDALAENDAPSPVARSELTAAPPPADASSNGTVTPLAVEEFDGRFWALPTWGDACPSDALGARHAVVIPSGATHARFELAADDETYEVHARLTMDATVVGEGDAEGEALVWFCDGVTLIDHGYAGSASFFDAPPPEDYAVLEGP